MPRRIFNTVVCVCTCVFIQSFSCAYAVRCDDLATKGKHIINTQIDSYHKNFWVTTDEESNGKLYLVNNYYEQHAHEIIRMAQMAQLLNLKVEICYKKYSNDYDIMYTLMIE